MMPVFFKIFFLFFLQQGKEMVMQPVEGVATRQVMAAKEQTDIMLSVQAEPEMMETVLGICLMSDPRCEIKRGEQKRVSVFFSGINAQDRKRMMQQVGALRTRANIEWTEQ